MEDTLILNKMKALSFTIYPIQNKMSSPSKKFLFQELSYKVRFLGILSLKNDFLYAIVS